MMGITSDEATDVGDETMTMLMSSFIDKLLELVYMVAGDVVDGSAHLLAIYIEGSGNT